MFQISLSLSHSIRLILFHSSGQTIRRLIAERGSTQRYIDGRISRGRRSSPLQKRIELLLVRQLCRQQRRPHRRRRRREEPCVRSRQRQTGRKQNARRWRLQSEGRRCGRRRSHRSKRSCRKRSAQQVFPICNQSFFFFFQKKISKMKQNTHLAFARL